MRYRMNSACLMRPPPLVRIPIRSESGLSGQGGQARPASGLNNSTCVLVVQYSKHLYAHSDVTAHVLVRYGALRAHPDVAPPCMVRLRSACAKPDITGPVLDRARYNR